MITSIQNQQIKTFRKLHQRKHREQLQQFLVEGYHLVEEALKSDWEVEHIVMTDQAKKLEGITKEKVMLVNQVVFNHLSQTESPQEIMAVIKKKKFQKITGKRLLLIDRIQDPGNLGTIIRTAVAAGYDAIVLGKGTVDPFNDKVLRATQGAVFHLPLIKKDLRPMIDRLKKDSYTIVASCLEGAKNVETIKKPDKFALVLGNEGSGISPEILSESDIKVKIPIYGEVESLNVSVAAGILMYQLR